MILHSTDSSINSTSVVQPKREKKRNTDPPDLELGAKGGGDGFRTVEVQRILLPCSWPYLLVEDGSLRLRGRVSEVQRCPSDGSKGKSVNQRLTGVRCFQFFNYYTYCCTVVYSSII